MQELLGILRARALAAESLADQRVKEDLHHAQTAGTVAVLIDDCVDRASSVAVVLLRTRAAHVDVNPHTHLGEQLLLHSRVETRIRKHTALAADSQ